MPTTSIQVIPARLATLPLTITMLLTGTLLSTMPVLAQTQTRTPTQTSSGEQETENALEKITVTAQRRQQNIQDVPISITAFSGEKITRYNIRSASDYLAQAPNVGFTEDGQTGSRGLGISIRGVNNLVTGETAFVNSIGVYMDGFSVASVPNQVPNPQLPDLDQVEILRGPQGTYFGRNSLGGVLNLTTRQPTDDLEGRIIVGAETYEGAGEQANVTGIVNIPVTETFKLRLTGMYEDSSGLVENLCAKGAPQANCPGAVENNVEPNGAKDSGHEYTMLRLNTTWDATAKTQINTTLMFSDESQGHDENVPSGVLDLDTVDSLGIEQAIDPGTGFYPDNQNRVSRDLDEFTDNTSTIGILNVHHRWNNSTDIKFIAGFIDASLDRLFDNDLIGGVDALRRDNNYDGFSWSTELRMEKRLSNGNLVLGVLHAKDEQEQENKVGISSNPTATINGIGFLPPFPEGLGLLLNEREFNVTSNAIFADVSWQLSPTLELIVGGRYTRDKVENRLSSFGTAPSCGCGPGDPAFFPSFINVPRPASAAEETFTDFAPRAVLNYSINDKVKTYLTVSKGYKAGGTSLGNNTNAEGSPAFSVSYNKETVWNYEAGFKSDLNDGQIRFNGAVYHLQWDDLQLESFRFLTPGDLSSNFEQTINVDKAEATGVELELQALLTADLELQASLGYQDTEITSDSTAEITGGFVVALQGLPLPKAPELTASAALEYHMELAGNDAWLRIEYVYRDGQYSDVEGLTNFQTRGASPNSGLTRAMPFGEFPYRSPDYNLVNLRFGYDLEDWQLNVFVQNLFEEDYYTGTQENFGASGIRLRPHPRVVGASIGWSF